MALPYRVPHRIETERLVLRRFVADDAAQLAAVIPRNMDHLRTFMKWIAFEPQTIEQREQLIADFARKFDTGEDYTLGMFNTEGELVGSTGYHVRTAPDRLAIGYWIDQDHEGQGFVTEACAALTHVALKIAGADIVDISHAPRNTRSAAVPARLGYVRQGTSGEECFDSGDMQPSVTWFATQATLHTQPLASTPRPRTFAAAGTALPWPARDDERASPA